MIDTDRDFYILDVLKTIVSKRSSDFDIDEVIRDVEKVVVKFFPVKEKQKNLPF